MNNTLIIQIDFDGNTAFYELYKHNCKILARTNLHSMHQFVIQNGKQAKVHSSLEADIRIPQWRDIGVLEETRLRRDLLVL